VTSNGTEANEETPTERVVRKELFPPLPARKSNKRATDELTAKVSFYFKTIQKKITLIVGWFQ
jgi:hypothetical protein